MGVRKSICASMVLGLCDSCSVPFKSSAWVGGGYGIRCGEGGIKFRKKRRYGLRGYRNEEHWLTKPARVMLRRGVGRLWGVGHGAT